MQQIHTLPKKHRYAAREYMGEQFKNCFHQLEDEVAKFIDDMKERREWEDCGVSYKTVSEHWDQLVLRTETRKAEVRERDKFLDVISQNWGENILYSFKTNRFQIEPSDTLLRKGSQKISRLRFSSASC